MLKNYLVIAWRNLLRHKLYSAINIVGLAVGLAGSILILLYIRHELSYDAFHPAAERLYRLVKTDYPLSYPMPLAPLITRELPEVAEAVRLTRPGEMRPLISYDQTQFYREVIFADANFFEIFAFPLLRGSPGSVLQKPNNMAISREMARLYFGDENPLGKRLLWDNSHEYVVTGVFERPPNTHFDLDLIASLSTLAAEPSFGAPDLNDWKVRPPIFIYLALEEGAEVEGLGRKIFDLGVEQIGLDAWSKLVGVAPSEYDSPVEPFRLQSVRDIHLHSHFQREYRNNGDIDYIYLTAGIAFFLLLMACINFTNLATARSVYRSREVGLRKVVGAYRTHLLGQFLGESVLMAFVALLLALVLVWEVTPAFGTFMDRPLALRFDIAFVCALLFLTLLCGLTAGAYPALFLSSHRPTQILKPTARAQGSLLRRALVVFQFALSTGLIVATLTVYGQVQYMSEKKLGYNKEQVIYFRIGYPGVRAQVQAAKNTFLQHSGVVASALFEHVPSTPTWPGLLWQVEGREPVKLPMTSFGPGYVEMMQMEVLAGRTFSENRPSEGEETCMINRSATERLGFASPEEAVGKTLLGSYFSLVVIGVIEDYHVRSLHYPIEPLLMSSPPTPEGYSRMGVRIRPENMPETLEYLQKTWRRFVPHMPLGYHFLDEKFEALYRDEQRAGKMMLCFSSLAVGLAFLGVFALAAFDTERRAKEIGIRRVLGASVASVCGLLSGEFVRLSLLANLIAWPLAYWTMHLWLQNFAYRIEQEFWGFFAAGALVLLVAWVTVSYQAAKAAVANPTDVLRSE